MVELSTTSRAKPLILLVEDCEDNRDMYAAFLTRRGFEVAEAADGAQAIEQSKTLSPDLVVMDLTLPDMDGTQAIQELRKEPRTENTPIIVVSGYVRPDGETNAQGWNAFLSKPCPPDVLIEKINTLLTPHS